MFVSARRFLGQRYDTPKGLGDASQETSPPDRQIQSGTFPGGEGGVDLA